MRAPCSRRRFLSGSLLLPVAIAAPALARAAVRPAGESPPQLDSRGVASRAAHGTATDTDTGTSSGAVRPVGFADNRLTTEVFIDGRGPYHFLVDTGAERTLIAQEIAAQLALPQGREVMVEGIIRGQPSPLVRIGTLRMGSLVCRRLEVPVLPRAMLHVDGYLGLDVLDRHRVIFDFRARTLTVTEPRGFFSSLWTDRDEAVVRTLGNSGRLRASDCLVNGVLASAFIDSGAEVSVSNPALYAALKRRAPAQTLVLGREGLYGVTGGSVLGSVINVDDIKVDELGLTYTNLVVAALQVFEEWGLSRQPALLFGMDCLRRFQRVTIDYGRKELCFEIARAQMPPALEAGLAPPLTG